jgi:hypothetical protein
MSLTSPPVKHGGFYMDVAPWSIELTAINNESCCFIDGISHLVITFALHSVKIGVPIKIRLTLLVFIILVTTYYVMRVLHVEKGNPSKAYNLNYSIDEAPSQIALRGER